MHQRAAAKAAWQAAGLYEDARLRAFFDAFEQCQEDCWAALSARVRDQNARHKRRLAAPLWASGDKLLRLNLMKTYLRGCDPATDVPEITAFIESGHPIIVAAAQKKT